MKQLGRKIRMFIRLLFAKEYYLIIITDSGYVADSEIKFGNLVSIVEEHKKDFISQELLIDQAKELLK